MTGKAEAKAITRIFSILEKLPDAAARRRVASYVNEIANSPTPATPAVTGDERRALVGTGPLVPQGTEG